MNNSSKTKGISDGIGEWYIQQHKRKISKNVWKRETGLPVHAVFRSTEVDKNETTEEANIHRNGSCSTSANSEHYFRIGSRSSDAAWNDKTLHKGFGRAEAGHRRYPDVERVQTSQELNDKASNVEINNSHSTITEITSKWTNNKQQKESIGVGKFKNPIWTFILF